VDINNKITPFKIRNQTYTPFHSGHDRNSKLKRRNLIIELKETITKTKVPIIPRLNLLRKETFYLSSQTLRSLTEYYSINNSLCNLVRNLVL
jgi:hypothetical protein